MDNRPVGRILGSLASASVAQVLVAAAFVPGAPVLVPELSGPALSEVAPVRAAAFDVCGQLAEMCSRWVLVGAGDPRREMSARGTLAGFGVDVAVELVPGSDEPTDAGMPTTVLIGGWLRTRTAPHVALTVEVVDPAAPAQSCLRQGSDLRSRLASAPEPVGLLVVADGATTITEKSPGGLKRGAVEFQDMIDDALAAADHNTISGLDESRCAEFGVEGRAAWQVASGAFAGPSLASEVRYAGAPFGVGYTVAWWNT